MTSIRVTILLLLLLMPVVTWAAPTYPGKAPEPAPHFKLSAANLTKDFLQALAAIKTAAFCSSTEPAPNVSFSLAPGSMPPQILHLPPAVLFPETIESKDFGTACSPHYDFDSSLAYPMNTACLLIQGHTHLRHVGIESINTKASCSVGYVKDTPAMLNIGFGDITLTQFSARVVQIDAKHLTTAIRLLPVTTTASRTVTLSQGIIDLEQHQALTTPLYGLTLPVLGLKTVQFDKLIFGFDPTKNHHPIVYVDGDGVPTTAPVAAPTTLLLQRSGDTLTLSGAVASEIVRIEAFRPPRGRGSEYIEQYATSDGKSVDWDALTADGIFVEWHRPDAVTGSTTFSIPNLPLYKKSALSACEWKNCNGSGSDACAIGRGYVVIGFDSLGRPSEIAMTDSYGDASADFPSIRAKCEMANQGEQSPPLTDSFCATHEHVVDDTCTALTCAADQIANNHQCVACGINEDVKANQCVLKTCASNEVLKDGACTAMTCGPGQILKGTACACDTANGYAAKNFTSNACVKVAWPTKKEKKDEKGKKPQKDKPTENSAEKKPTPNTNSVTPDTLDSASPCGPGLQRYGTFCVTIPPLPSAQIPATTSSPKPTGGCSLIF